MTGKHIDMERTQVYLPAAMKAKINFLATMDDTNASAVIRAAVEDYAKRRLKDKKKRQEAFRKALDRCFGMWKDRDPKEFEAIRRSADRRLDEWGV